MQQLHAGQLTIPLFPVFVFHSFQEIVVVANIQILQLVVLTGIFDNMIAARSTNMISI